MDRLGGNANGGATVFEMSGRGRERVATPAHGHDDEETIYGIEGVLTWTMDGKRIDVGPGPRRSAGIFAS